MICNVNWFIFFFFFFSCRLVVPQKPKENHRLSHNWIFANGTRIPIERPFSTLSIFSTAPTPLPDWIVNDRKVIVIVASRLDSRILIQMFPILFQILCFKAYFRENLQETHTASYQIRKVKILFYLEDGTIQVNSWPIIFSSKIFSPRKSIISPNSSKLLSIKRSLSRAS